MRDLFIRLINMSGARIYSVLLGVISLTLTARMLGPEGRGQIVAVTTWITAFSTIGHLSLGQVSMRQASLNFTGDWLSRSLSLLLINTTLMTFLSAVILGGTYYLNPGLFGGISMSLLMVGFCMLPTMIWESYGGHLLSASNNIEFYNRSQVISRTVGLILLVFLLYIKPEPTMVVVSNAVAFLLSAVFCINFYLKKIRLSLPSRQDIITYYKSGLLLHLNTIGTFIFSGADVLIINYFRGSKDTGLYQLGLQIISVMLIVPNSAAMIIYSQLTSHGPDHGWINQKKMIYFLTGLMTIGSILVGLTAGFWLPLIAGNKFSESVSIFQLQLIAIPLMTFCTVVGPQWISRGLFWQASVSAILLALINLVGNRILIPKYGVFGAVWTSIIAYGVASIVNLGLFKYCDMKMKKALLNDAPSSV